MAKRGENIRKRKDGRWEGRFIKGRKSDRTAIWGYIYGHSYNEVLCLVAGNEKFCSFSVDFNRFSFLRLHIIPRHPCRRTT